MSVVFAWEDVRGRFVAPRENVTGPPPERHGQEHSTIQLGLVACRHGVKTRLVTAASIVNEMPDALQDERRLRFQKTFARYGC